MLLNVLVIGLFDRKTKKTKKLHFDHGNYSSLSLKRMIKVQRWWFSSNLPEVSWQLTERPSAYDSQQIKGVSNNTEGSWGGLFTIRDKFVLE